MTSLEFAEILNDLSFYAGFLPVLSAIVFWKYQQPEMRVFAINQFFWVLITFFSIYLQKQSINNHFVNYLHNIRIIFFVWLMYWVADKNQNHRKILLISGIILIGFNLIEWLFFQKNEWSISADSIVNIPVILVSIFYLEKIISTATQSLYKIPFWWVVVTLLVSFFIQLLSTYFSNSALKYSTEVFLTIWNFISVIIILSKILFAYAFYVSKKYYLK